MAKLIESGLADVLKSSEAATPLVEWLHTETGVSRVWLRLGVRGLSVLAQRAVKEGTALLRPAAQQRVTAMVMRIPGVERVLESVERRVAQIKGAAEADAGIRAALGARDDGSQATEHLATAQWSQYAALQATDDLHDVVVGLQDAVAELSHPQPALGSRHVRDTHRNRFIFAARRAALVGREKELAELVAFFFSDAPFAWRVLAGPAGVGKSRLALEACLAVGGVYRAGFLDASSDFPWDSWRPNQPTILVADYADAVAGTLHRVAARLASNDTLEFPVRLLLIARQPDGRWLDEFVGTGSEGGAVRDAMGAPALALAGLDDDALWSVAMRFCAALDPAPPREGVLRALARIDPLRRPLFAAFAGDALASGRNMRAWNAEALLNDVLRRDEDRTWRPAGVGPRDTALLALATMTGGLALDAITGLDPAWFPTGEDFEPARYDAMSGGPVTDWLGPLEPDILGELFVLNALQPKSSVDRKRLRAVRDAAWRTDPWATAAFVVRAAADHRRHPTLAPLLDTPDVANIETLEAWATVLSLLANQYAAVGDFPTARRLIQRVVASGKEHPDNGWIRLAEAVARTPLAIPQRSPAADAAATSEMDVIQRISDAFESDPAFRIAEARAHQVRVSVLLGMDRVTDARGDVQHLRSLNERHTEVPPIRELYAVALTGFVIWCCQHFDIWEMMSLALVPECDALAALASAHPDDVGVQFHWKNAREVIDNRGLYDVLLQSLEMLEHKTPAHQARERRQQLVAWAKSRGYPAPEFASNA